MDYRRHWSLPTASGIIPTCTVNPATQRLITETQDALYRCQQVTGLSPAEITAITQTLPCTIKEGCEAIIVWFTQGSCRVVTLMVERYPHGRVES